MAIQVELKYYVTWIHFMGRQPRETVFFFFFFFLFVFFFSLSPETGFDSKRNEFDPTVSVFFPFRVYIFLKGTWCAGKQNVNVRSCLPCKYCRKVILLLEPTSRLKR